MIIESLISGKKNVFWILFHIVLGIVCTVTPYVLIFWFYVVLILSLNKAIVNLRNNQPIIYISLFVYLIGFEMLGRMAHAFPFIPTESSKYFLVLFSIVGITKNNKKGKTNWLLLSLLISIGLLYDYSEKRVIVDIINNYLGVLAISIGLFFLSVQKLNSLSFEKILSVLLLVIIPSLVYTYIKTPEFDDISFALKANFATSGGAATNQVSTVFGLGFFLSFYFWFKRIYFSGNRLFDLLLGIAFFAQGLLTFSRGGILVAIVAVIILILFNSNGLNLKFFLFALIGLIILIFTFNYIDKLTDGKLYLRYQGETEGTYKYGAERNLNKITSGRAAIFEEDLNLWFSHPIMGVGVGASRYLRGGGLGDLYVSSHIELSRLLAEHGFFGLVYFIAILNLGFKLWRNSKIESWRQVLFIIYMIALLTSFHSAMRTFVTPLLMALSSIGMYNVKKIDPKGFNHWSN